MTDLTKFDDVRGLQINLRLVFESEAGKEVMQFLEESVGFYGSIYDPTDRDMILINDGKRQIVATLKTLLRLDPSLIVAMAKSKE